VSTTCVCVCQQRVLRVGVGEREATKTTRPAVTKNRKS
jgi:hypothetical protein